MNKLLDKWNKQRQQKELEKKEKELLTFKDGKIKSIPKNEDEKEIPVQSVQFEKQFEKKDGMSPVVKGTLSIALLGLAVWIGLEVNQIISTPNPVPEENNNSSITEPMDKNAGNNDSNTNVVNKDNTVEKLFSSEKDKTINLINLTNQTNQQLLTLLAENEKSIGEYKSQFINRVSLQAKLKNNIINLETYLNLFIQSKTNFQSLGLENIYNASIQRYDNLLMYGNEQYEVSKEYGTSFETLRTNYVQKDESYEKLQRKQIINFLKERNIKYSINPVTNQIEYVN